jgi:branched-chain amino acid transport system substrate-binding protein
MSFSRRTLLGGSVAFAAVAATGCASSATSGAAGPAASGPIVFGVSGPRTGPNAEYGKAWDQGFTLALEEINGAGGINGRKVELKWEDSQADAKQSVPIAEKFVADPSVIAELGDFASPASMAASSIYQDNKLVQFGFTNSNPKFTDGGDRMWTTSLTQDYYQYANVEGVTKAGIKKVSLYYLQTDWGKTSFDSFSKYAKEKGLEIAYSSPIQPDGDDYRPVLIKGRDAGPDAVVHIGYAPDGGRLVKQLREVGFTKPFYGGQITQQFIDVGGKAAEGTILHDTFIVNDTTPRVAAFVEKFRKKYSTDPGFFQASAYDALNVLVQATKEGGPTREGVHKGFSVSGKKFSTILLGDFTFNANRRPDNVPLKTIVVKDGKFVVGG